MFLRRLKIKNVRSIRDFEVEFEKDKEAGWHVLLGPNGSGKSSIIRSFALIAMGQRESIAARQDLGSWITADESEASIDASFIMDNRFDTVAGGGKPPKKPIQCSLTLKHSDSGSVNRSGIAEFSGERASRTIWGSGQGWFSSSFGPFRRFTGGDRIYDRLFVSNKRLAPHLTALGEDVALTEALSWLSSLWVQVLQDREEQKQSHAMAVLETVFNFLNGSNFLPHGAILSKVTNEEVIATDGNGARIPISKLSDGYRSALSLVVELLRQMFEIFGHERMLSAMRDTPGTVQASGVVAIDEIDAHLHPTWQRDIGKWLTRTFPRVQFIVTTHSPLVCRAVATSDATLNGSVWRLPTPGSSEAVRRISGVDLDQLVYGDVLDAYGTELFGNDVSRSKIGTELVERLAVLNHAALERELTEPEKQDRRRLRAIFPSEAGNFG